MSDADAAESRDQASANDASVLSEATRDQLEVLDRFEHRRRTWELELLISGAVVFAMLGVPPALNAWYQRTEVHVSEDQYLILILGFTYMKLAAWVLIAAFCLNLSARAYWIGLVGLQKVFPDGINWGNSKDGPIAQGVYRSLPSVEQLITGADRFSSLIFASSIITVVALIAPIFMFGPLVPVAWAITKYALGGDHFVAVFYGLMMLLIMPPTIGLSYDRKLKDKSPEEWQNRWYVKPIRKSLVVFQWIGLRHLYSSIQLTLSTNLPRKLGVALFVGFFVGAMALFLFSFMTMNVDRLTFHGYRYVPDVGTERSVRPQHYENLGATEMVSRPVPSIQSDVIQGPYIRLFIPHSPTHNSELEELCSDLEPVPRQGYSLGRIKRRVQPELPTLETALSCIGQFHEVFLNGERLQLEYDYYTHPETEVRGIVSYLPTKDLPVGRNVLRIERVRVEDEGDSESESSERKREYFIPFWL